MTRTRSILAAVCCAALALAAGSGTASARTLTVQKGGGVDVLVTWLDTGTRPGAEGNAHLYFVEVIDGWPTTSRRTDERANATGFDFSCSEGALDGIRIPDDVWDRCSYVGSPYLLLAKPHFTMNHDLSSAHLTATLLADADGTPASDPGVDITWTGIGSTTVLNEVQTSQVDCVEYTTIEKRSLRDATATGSLGAQRISQPRELQRAQLTLNQSSTKARTVQGAKTGC